MGRKAVHADAAARKEASRAKFSRLEIQLDPELAAKVAEIAAALDESKTAVVINMVKFALTNHNWKRDGLTFLRTTQKKGD